MSVTNAEATREPAQGSTAPSSATATPTVVVGPPPRGRQPALSALLHRRTLLGAGAALTLVGLLVALFCLYEVILSGFQERRSQAELRRELTAAFTVAVGAASDGSGTEEIPEDLQDDLVISDLGADAATDEQLAPEPLTPGTPIALLQIDRIHLSKVVVEGTTSEQLKRGPGHFRNTPLPGERGNVVIAGRRTTYGAPFADLDDLRAGDEIVLTTSAGRFTYVVEPAPDTDSGGAAFRVEPGDADVLGYRGDDRLTLVTSAPAYLATERLAIVATLDGDPVPPLEVPRATVIDASESALAGDASGWSGVLLWGQLLVVTVGAGWILSRRWHAPSAWLLTAPLALALVLLLYESLDRLLPATL